MTRPKKRSELTAGQQNAIKMAAVLQIKLLTMALGTCGIARRMRSMVTGVSGR